MKKTVKSVMFGAVGALLLGGGVAIQMTTRVETQPSDLVAANIEAMADGEVDAGYVGTITYSSGDEDGTWTEDGSKFCVPHWESTACYDEVPSGEWCQSYYSRNVQCY